MVYCHIHYEHSAHQKGITLGRNVTFVMIGDWAERRKMEWNAHVLRMDQGRLVRIASDRAPQGMKPREDMEKVVK